MWIMAPLEGPLPMNAPPQLHDILDALTNALDEFSTLKVRFELSHGAESQGLVFILDEECSDRIRKVSPDTADAAGRERLR